MNPWRNCFALAVVFYLTAKTFDLIIPYRPKGEFWDMFYYGSAATIDWMMFKLTPLFVSGKLYRDVQALCIAYIVANAFGFYQYMAYAPPSTYNWTIKGLDYALAIRLIFTGGSNALNDFDWSGMVRSFIARCSSHQAN